MAQAAVLTESWDVNRRLVELGLEESFLVRAVQRGLAAWASCTANHPPVSAGSWAWGETVCGLRDELVQFGWSRSDEANLPLTINSEKTLAICVNTGDEDTGKKDGAPCTGSAKGPRTRHAILENLGQGILTFIDESLPPAEVVNRSGRQIWILLMYRDKKEREVRCELSRPISITKDGYVDGWAERIILRATPFDEDLIALTDGGNGPQSPEIDLEIKKRA